MTQGDTRQSILQIHEIYSGYWNYCITMWNQVQKFKFCFLGIFCHNRNFLQEQQDRAWKTVSGNNKRSFKRRPPKNVINGDLFENTYLENLVIQNQEIWAKRFRQELNKKQRLCPWESRFLHVDSFTISMFKFSMKKNCKFIYLLKNKTIS